MLNCTITWIVGRDVCVRFHHFTSLRAGLRCPWLGLRAFCTFGLQGCFFCGELVCLWLLLGGGLQFPSLVFRGLEKAERCDFG